MRIFPIAAVLLATPALPVKAQDCASATSQAELNVCAGRAFDKADATLNTTYKAIMKKLEGNPEKRKLLVDAQKEWVKLRDLDCAFAASGVVGGSAYRMVVLNCREDSTRQRLKTLRSWSTCPEGDLGCPLPR